LRINSNAISKAQGIHCSVVKVLPEFP